MNREEEEEEIVVVVPGSMDRECCSNTTSYRFQHAILGVCTSVYLFGPKFVEKILEVGTSQNNEI